MQHVTLRNDFLDAIHFRAPRSTPCFADFTPATLAEFCMQTGQDDPAEYFQQAHREIGIQAGFKQSVKTDTGNETAAADPDLAFLKIPIRPGSLHHYVEFLHPMADFETARQVADYDFPDYEALFDSSQFARAVAEIQKRGLAVVGDARLVFVLACHLRGMERLLCDFYDNPELATVLLDRLTEMSIFKARACARAGVDMLFVYEDVATQNGLLMSPAMWRRWFKPRMARTIAAAREIRPDLPVLYDSDGDMTAIIDDLLDVGVNAISPMQPECMDLDAIHADYGDRLVFWGTIGVQRTLPFGSPTDVREAVRHAIQTYGTNGGLVIGPAHVISPDIPWCNIMAFFDAVRDYGS